MRTAGAQEEGGVKRPRRPAATAREIEVLCAEDRPLIPPGRYQALGAEARIVWAFGRHTLAVVFHVQVSSESETGRSRVPLFRYYPVRLISRGRFRAGASSDYVRDWIRGLAPNGRTPQMWA
jgi:hypothetical protein